MEERGPIQLPPYGLLGLLQLKADGRGVQRLGDACIPSLEMAGWWLRSAARILDTTPSETIAAGNVRTFRPFTTNPVTVPNGETWFVHDYAVSFGVDTSATGLCLAWAFNSGGTVRYAGLPSLPGSQNAIGAATGLTALLTAHDFWLPPGARLGFWVDQIVSATVMSATCNGLRYTVCPA